METHSEAGKVNVSRATFELLKDDPQFTFESRGEKTVKGKGQMEMWSVNMKTEKE
jgi:class 3 adenylate cyclase